jgi:hypothetical protein
MPDNAQPRYDATPKQDGSLIGRDLGEAIYARHARFVWPTSIASSLARRFAPFTDERLPLAMVVQRRWSVVNSSVARTPAFHWLQAFTPGSPRNAVSARRQYATGTIATPLATSVTSPSAPERALSMAPEIFPSPAHDGAPPASAPQEADRSFLSGAAQDESAIAQRSTEVSGQVTGHSLPAASNRSPADFASRVTELTLRTAPEARSAAGEMAPTANPPQELGAAPANRVVQDGSKATDRFSEVSRQIGRVAAPVAPTVHTDASVSGSVLGRPVTVYSAPPIIRRSVASRQRGIAHTDSAGHQISESSNATREIAAQRSSEVTPIEPSISAEPGSGSSKTDRVTFDSPDSHNHSLQSHSLAGRTIAREAQAADLHHINQSSIASRIQDAVARQPLQLSSHEASSQNPTAAPSQIVSPDRATTHNSLIITYATARSHEASTEPASPQGSIAARSLAPEVQRASGSGQAVPETAAPSQTPSQSLPQEARHTSVPHVAEDATRDRIVVPESHTDAPATAMLHLNESSSHAPTVTSADRTGESYGSALPSPGLRTKSASAVDRSAVHLKSDCVSPDISSARSYTNDPFAALAPGPSIYAAPRIHAPGHSSEGNLSRSDLQGFGASKRSEPTFRSTSSILRSAGTKSALGSSSRNETSRNTMVPVVVQESAVAGASQAEPLVLSRQAISGDASHDLAASLSGSSVGPATSSPAASIATQSIGLMHRNPSTMARSASSYGSGAMHLASLPVSRQATADTILSSMQLPSLPSVTAGAGNAPSFGGASPDIIQLANRVYDVLVRRLASERQRRGR